MTDLTLFTGTIANRYYYTNVATMAPDIETAQERFEKHAASQEFIDAAKEERSMWIEELGEYPGDDAYTYELCEKMTERDAYIPNITPSYISTITEDTEGNVFNLDSGANG